MPKAGKHFFYDRPRSSQKAVLTAALGGLQRDDMRRLFMDMWRVCWRRSGSNGRRCLRLKDRRALGAAARRTAHSARADALAAAVRGRPHARKHFLLPQGPLTSSPPPPTAITCTCYCATKEGGNRVCMRSCRNLLRTTARSSSLTSIPAKAATGRGPQRRACCHCRCCCRCCRCHCRCCRIEGATLPPPP